eukprot:Tbor_TRINITY_DN3015_c0_g1::TRINITY_DN3015_c0_g1_i1::g.17394::m.17394
MSWHAMRFFSSRKCQKLGRSRRQRKFQKKRRMEASSVCFICGVDFDSLDGISILIRRLMKWKGAKTEDELKTKFNTPVPSSDEIIELMRERRTQHPVFYRPDRDRIYADASFYNTETKRFHKVHCRCAHLTTDYQNGLPLTEVMMEAELMQTCDFCGELGATVRCCAPGCKFCVHTTCAVFSGGQVDFDQWDPYVMNPACRAHTYHARRKKKIIFDASDAGEMNELQDGVRIIRRYELRDPDDE